MPLMRQRWQQRRRRRRRRQNQWRPMSRRLRASHPPGGKSPRLHSGCSREKTNKATFLLLLPRDERYEQSHRRVSKVFFPPSEKKSDEH